MSTGATAGATGLGTATAAGKTGAAGPVAGARHAGHRAARASGAPFKAILAATMRAGGPAANAAAGARGSAAPNGLAGAAGAAKGAASSAAHAADGERARGVKARPERDDGELDGHGHARGRDARRAEDALDPSLRHAAQMAPPALSGPVCAPVAASAPEVRARASLEELMPGLVKRIAWAGDARRGSVRMELGAGELGGGTVLVHADEGRVRVEIAAPVGVDCAAWKQRILARLEGRGVTVDAIEVS